MSGVDKQDIEDAPSHAPSLNIKFSASPSTPSTMSQLWNDDATPLGLAFQLSRSPTSPVGNCCQTEHTTPPTTAPSGNLETRHTHHISDTRELYPLRTRTFPEPESKDYMLQKSTMSRSLTSPTAPSVHTSSHNLLLNSSLAQYQQDRALAFDTQPQLAIQLADQDTAQTPKHSLLMTEWMVIRRCRTSCMIIKASVRDLRRQLRKQEDIKDDFEDQLFTRIRRFGSVNVHPAMIGNEFQVLMASYQQAKDEYGPMEIELMNLEDKLEREEYHLHEVEDEFYSKWEIALRDCSAGGKVPIEIVVRKLDYTAERSDTSINPLLDEYLAKQGELDLLIEQLHEIIAERHSLVEEQESLRIIQRELPDEDQAWLDNAEEMYLALEDKVKVQEREVFRLKIKCLELNLIDEDGNPVGYHTEQEHTSDSERNIQSETESSVSTNIPTMVAPPLTLENTGARFNTDTKMAQQKTAERINQWLLDILRCSTIQVNLLARIHGHFTIYGRDREQWQSLVLRFWFSDNTLSFEAYTSSMGSTQPPDSRLMLHQAKLPEIAQRKILASLSTNTPGKVFRTEGRFRSFSH